MSFTAKEMLPAIDSAVRVQFEALSVSCRVMDVKSSYGKVRLLVKPDAGSGSQWVELARVATFTPPTQPNTNLAVRL